MSAPTPAHVKGLFYQLVKAVGGVEAAGAFLGISHQRVSQLQSPSSADLPSLMHVLTLEAVAKQAVVTGALAKMVESEDETASDTLTETCEAVVAASNVLHLVQTKAPKREILAGLVALQRETADVVATVA